MRGIKVNMMHKIKKNARHKINMVRKKKKKEILKIIILNIK